MLKTDKELKLWRLNFTMAGLGMAALYWLVESLLHAFYWKIAPLSVTLLAQSEPDELSMRLVIVAMMVGFGWLTEQGKQHYQTLVTKQQRTNRLLHLLSECNQHVQRKPDEQSMLDAVCRAAVDIGEFRVAWVGMQRPEGFTLVEWASADPALNEQEVLPRGSEALLNCSGCRATLDEGVAQICELGASEGCPAPWKEPFLSQGCRNAYALPIRVSGKVVGVFAIYAGEEGILSGEERSILDEVADDVSVALNSIEHEKLRQQAEEALRKRMDELERFQKATVDREFRIKELRDEIEQLQGDVKRLKGEKP